MLAPVLILLLQAAEPPASAEVVVTARKRKCQLAIADRVIGSAEFKARAAEWRSGTPVRVVAEPGTSYKCLAKIVWRLGEHGVTRVNFDPPPPARPPAD